MFKSFEVLINKVNGGFTYLQSIHFVGAEGFVAYPIELLSSGFRESDGKKMLAIWAPFA